MKLDLIVSPVEENFNDFLNFEVFSLLNFEFSTNLSCVLKN